MTADNTYESVKDFAFEVARQVMLSYWQPMYQRVKANPELVSIIPGFLINPEKLILYIGKTHIGIEYVGCERLTELPPSIHSKIEFQFFDYSLTPGDLLDEIIGYDYGKDKLKLPLPPVTYDLILPTNAGLDELHRLKWNWAAQEFIAGYNTGGITAPIGQFTRIINGRFFDADKFGLKTRYIRWLDLIPCKYDDSGKELDSFTIDFGTLKKLVIRDSSTPFPMPEGLFSARLQKINRFIELIGGQVANEQEITQFLANDEYKFILKMRFAAKDVCDEIQCEWQGDNNRKAIKPDFFVISSDNFADIVEFKLPNVCKTMVVGRENRETFSAEVNSYIAQTRVYREYFDDPRNRSYIEHEHGFRVYKPRRILIIGRRWDLANEDWRKIAADYNELKLMTYDDLVDGVIVQFYD